jgi:type III restriction enzyme
VPVSIQFDSAQNYQLDAIAAVTDLFEGWSTDRAESVVQSIQESDPDVLFNDSCVSNKLGISNVEVLSNARKVQNRTRTDANGSEKEVIPSGSRLPESLSKEVWDFDIEMETGTGKTYVYLRTAIELYVKFGISKVIIVVPTVAIREGVQASIELMREHFRELYAGLVFDSYVYDSKQLSRLRQFASSSHLQLMIMNIQAFNKDTTLIMKDDIDGFYGLRPIEYITQTSPVLILDEPQKLGTKAQKEAISNLNPLIKFGYSATHKENTCLIYRLGPVDAYEQRLVKRIEVLSMSADEDHNIAYVEIRKITLNGNSSPTATAVINKGGKRVNFTIRKDDDLAAVTKMGIYKGWEVEDIHAGDGFEQGYVEFRNGRKIRVNTSNDVDQDWWQRAQIEATIERHFDTELRLKQAAGNGEIKPMKALTLFFIDRVANYAEEDSKFKLWFEELYLDISERPKYKNLDMPKPSDAHRGYFASTKGKAKDTKGDSNDDADAYDLIMRDKERLLSLEEPVRFIFSHSALSEGWDNPNVFTICNLQETQSEVRRRQQIGRGLRLPVMENGERSRVEHINILTVVASETFEKYAAGLQKEMREETGEAFEGVVDARSRKTIKLRENYKDLPGFQKLWDAISPRSNYRVDFETQDLIDEATLRLKLLGNSEPIRTPKIVIKRTQIAIESGKDIHAGTSNPGKELKFSRRIKMPDILGELQSVLPISRSSIVKIVNNSGRLQEALINPAQFIAQVRSSIQSAIANLIPRVDGIEYTKLAGCNAAYLPEFKELESYDANIQAVQKSIYEAVIVDSNIERKYAIDLDARPDVEIFIKLPDWFKISTPVGKYNPDWAMVKKLEDGKSDVCFIRETKGTLHFEELRFDSEAWKIYCGYSHFKAIGVNYNVATNANQLDTDIPFDLGWFRKS